MVDIQAMMRPLQNVIEEVLQRRLPQQLSGRLRGVGKILALVGESSEDCGFGWEGLITEINQNLEEFQGRQNQEEQNMRYVINETDQELNITKSNKQNQQNTQKQCEQELSIACHNFCKQLSALPKDHILPQDDQNQKENSGDLKDTLVLQLLQENINTLRNKISDYMLLLTTNTQQRETQNNLLGCQKVRQQKHSKSSVRSLLTEKLKQIQLEYNEDDLMNSPEKGAIKGNWVLKQMKTNIKCNQSVGGNNYNYSQPDIDNFRQRNISSQSLTKKQEPRRFQSHRIILGEINLQESDRKERKVKQKEGGCARCEIY